MRMINKNFALIAMVLLVGLGGCKKANITIGGSGPSVEGSGVSETEVREIGDFKFISFNGAGNVIINVGGEPGIQISADDNILEMIETEVTGDTLEIRFTGSVSPKTETTFEVSAKQLEVFELAGAAFVILNGVKGKSFKVVATAAGSIVADGEVDDLDVEIKGAGTVSFKNLKSKNAILHTSGAANAAIYASESFEGTIDGIGNVSVFGDPANFKKKINGLGSVRKAD